MKNSLARRALAFLARVGAPKARFGRAALMSCLLLLVQVPLALAARPPAAAATWEASATAPSEGGGAALGERFRDGLPACACAARAELEARREQIAGTPDLASARELALADVAQARRAVAWARRVAPRSEKLRDADQRLDTYAAQVGQAEDPDEVARYFSDLVEDASGEDIVGVDGDHDGGDGGRCNLSTRETVAVVLGLILGIIPGLILLVLLC